MYRVIDRPRRLVFTWMSGPTENQETLVTVDFVRADKRTEVIVTHELLPESAMPSHNNGWTCEPRASRRTLPAGTHRMNGWRLLAEKTAVVYGGGGAIGGAAARVFAREGARVFLAGRTQSKLAAVARDIESAGGSAEFAVLDVFDEAAVHAHADAVAAKAGGIDIMLNAIGIAHVQGKPFAETTLAEFEQPITAHRPRAVHRRAGGGAAHDQARIAA